VALSNWQWAVALLVRAVISPLWQAMLLSPVVLVDLRPSPVKLVAFRSAQAVQRVPDQAPLAFTLAILLRREELET
jgi:hypothetical protein